MFIFTSKDEFTLLLLSNHNPFTLRLSPPLIDTYVVYNIVNLFYVKIGRFPYASSAQFAPKQLAPYLFPSTGNYGNPCGATNYLWHNRCFLLQEAQTSSSSTAKDFIWFHSFHLFLTIRSPLLLRIRTSPALMPTACGSDARVPPALMPTVSGSDATSHLFLTIWSPLL